MFSIYCIRDLTSKKSYIGRTKNLQQRIWDHKKTLKAERHCNNKLQEAYNLGHHFIFELLGEFSSEEEAKKVEEVLIRFSYASNYNENYGDLKGTVVTQKQSFARKGNKPEIFYKTNDHHAADRTLYVMVSKSNEKDIVVGTQRQLYTNLNLHSSGLSAVLSHKRGKSIGGYKPLFCKIKD